MTVRVYVNWLTKRRRWTVDLGDVSTARNVRVVRFEQVTGRVRADWRVGRGRHKPAAWVEYSPARVEVAGEVATVRGV